MIKNPYSDLTPEEAARREADKKAIADRLKKVSDSAKHILLSTDAEKYRKELIEARDDLIRMMMHSTEPDPVIFAFFCKSALNRLSVYYDLLDSIEGDAK